MKTPQQMLIELSDRGFSQNEIEKETGIPQGTISRIASGEHKNPRFDNVAAIASAHKRLMRRSEKKAA